MDAFYANRHVRKRLVEFLGGGSLAGATAVYLTHTVWRIGRASEVAARIGKLSPAPELIGLCLERMPAVLTGTILPEDQAVFAALALVIEYVAHRIKEKAAPLSQVPVELTAVHVGPSPETGKREMISIDISEYGDPLHTRVIRMPFTNYRKPLVAGLGTEGGFRTIPLYEMDFRQAIQVRQVDAEVLVLELSSGEHEPVDAFLARAVRAREFLERLCRVG